MSYSFSFVYCSFSNSASCSKNFACIFFFVSFVSTLSFVLQGASKLVRWFRVEERCEQGRERLRKTSRTLVTLPASNLAGLASSVGELGKWEVGEGRALARDTHKRKSRIKWHPVYSAFHLLLSVWASCKKVVHHEQRGSQSDYRFRIWITYQFDCRIRVCIMYQSDCCIKVCIT